MNLFQLLILRSFFLFFLCVHTLYAIKFTYEEKEWIEKNPIVKVGAEPDWAPIDFAEKGKHKGISNEYLNLVAKHTGLKFDIEIDLWKNNLQKMKEQTIDLLPALYYTDERNTYMQYSKSYFEILDYFFIRDDMNVTAMNDLKGKIVAITQGDARVDILKNKFPYLKILTVPSFNDAIDAVLEQKADILFDTYATVEYTLKNQSISSIVPFKSHRVNGTMKLYMASHKNNPLLASIVSKGLSAISHKEKKLIYDKWIHNESSTQDKATHTTLSEQENQWLKNHKTITFAGDPNWLPFEAFNDQGEYIGIVADYLYQIEKNVPLKFNTIQTQDWSETIAHAKAGDIDVISDDIDSKPLQKHYVPIAAYIKSPIVIVMREDHTFVSDLDEIDNKKIALITEYGYNAKVKKTYPDIPFSYEENADKAILSLSLGKIDAILLSLPKAQYLLGVQGYNNIKIVGKTKVTMGLTLFVKKDKPHLHSILQKIMKELVNTRHLDIFSKWQKVNFAEKIDYTLAYQVLGLFLLFVLGAWYWYRKVKIEEIKRKKSEAQMRMLIDNIPLNIVVSDSKGIILRVNQFALDTLCISKEEMLSHNVLEFYVNSEDREEILKTIQTQGQVIQKIIQFKRFHMDELDIMLSIIPIIYDEKKALLSIMVDLTERIEMEKQLQVAKNKADEASKAKSEFLSNMSHEIRTPMNAIIGFAELLNEQVEQPKLKGYTKTIKNAGNTLLRLINDILDLSKIEAGKFEITKRATNVADVSEEVLSMFMLTARDKALDLRLEIDPDVPKSLRIDDIRLRQILVNLVGNAVKFTQKGFVKLKISACNVDDHLSKLDVQITVEDTGIGVSKDKLESIFQSFEQQSGQDNSKYGGTGLGLSISKRLIEMMGGKVRVESMEGKGSKFIVDLYSVDISSVQILESSEENAESNTKSIVFKPAKILVVDDIDDNLELIVQSFEDTEVVVVTAKDGYAAIEQYKKEKPDVILMDIRMPKMDGYEATAKIREVDKDIPIIALTASVMQDEHGRLKSKYFNGYLRKPVLRDELFLVLSQYLSFEKVEPMDKDVKSKYFELNDNAHVNIVNIVDEMKKNIRPLYEQAQKSNNIEQIKIFASSVEALAHKYNVEPLKQYVLRLKASIDSFDIMKIKLMLTEYDALVLELSAIPISKI